MSARQRIRNIVWGKNLARARKYLIMGILEIALIGQTAVWAQPKIDKWLYPTPPAESGACTLRGISMSGTVPSGDTVRARAWIKLPADVKINGSVFVWNGEKNRVEFWMYNETHLYQIEFLCFEIVTPGTKYSSTFGEFEILSSEEAVKWDKELTTQETGDSDG